MITFKFTFLLSFREKKELNKSKTKFSKMENLNKEQPVTSDFDLEPKKDYELKTGDFVGNFRIEYELIPKKFRYGVDIICWSNVAKISTNEAYRYYRIIKNGDDHWTVLTIYHFMHELTEEELINLRAHVVIFNITDTKKDFTSRSMCLYCVEDEVKSNKFVEYFEDDPNILESFGRNEENEYKQASDKCLSSDCISSWLKFTGKTHSFRVYETIRAIKNGISVKYKEYGLPSASVEMEKAPDKQKGKKQEEKRRDPYFIFPAEVFFTDPKLAIYRMKEENVSVSDGFVFVSVQNLMTREQKSSLNPFVVKIKKLECLPVDLLQEDGYEKVFISYDIPSLAKYDSPTKPLEENIYFNDSRVFFTKDIRKMKYLEFIRTERVKVEIKGVKRAQQPIEPSLFGTKKEHAALSKRLQPREASKILRHLIPPSTIQVIAVADYDISSLLKDVWIFRQEASCHHPDNKLYGINKRADHALVDIRTMAEVNLEQLDEERSASPLLEGILNAACTTLDMEFHFVAPQFATRHLQENKLSFRRIFCTLYSRSLTHHLLASILQHNENIIGFNAILVDCVNIKEDKVKIELKKRKVSKQQQSSNESLWERMKGMVHEVDDVITGFMIDCGTEVHIFVEGISYGYILEIWNRIHKSNINVAKLYLNSEYDFENRLYESFLAFGIYRITLKKTLRELFEEQDIYMQGMVPPPCFKALQKLNMLFQTETLRKMLQFELFPHGNELISLNLEYGVPLKMYK
ncbi:hypothetical protein HHI36_012279 [Cryptolaemus montrouzieri]|uniref:DUF4550 domain-containing protein n=1 Tax=Cryptolaemus montrouzieri TaxID=559131 RepID=A0ABD2NFA2_9CUCU